MTGRGGRRRRTVVGIAIVAVLGAGVLAVRRLWPDDRARQVGTAEAVDRYRELTSTSVVMSDGPTTTAPAVAMLPAPGVYRYTTSGRETIDVLGGARHDYPAVTTLTVTDDGCGVLLRWDLLVERREEWRLCIGAEGLELQTTGAAYHEFFSNGRLEDVRCQHRVLLVPLDGEPRASTPWDCLLIDRPWPATWEVLGREAMTVAGAPVDVTHVRMTVDDDSTYWEHTTVDWWLLPNGLPAQMTTEKSSKSDSGVIGDVVYTEEYHASLIATEPLT